MLGRTYYEYARRQAVDLGDEASLAAVIYNRAALTLDQLRVGVALGLVDGEAVKFLELEVASARNFHVASGHKALTHLIDAATARLLLSNCDYAAAASLFSGLSRSARPVGFRSDLSLIRLEGAICLCEIGATDTALAELNAIDQDIVNQMAMDDALVFSDLYLRLGAKFLEEKNLKIFSALREKYKSEYQAERSVLRQILNEIRNRFDSQSLG